jgi:hypothetical protein
MARVKNVVAAVCEHNALLFVFPLAATGDQLRTLIKARHGYLQFTWQACYERMGRFVDVSLKVSNVAADKPTEA